MQIDCEKGDGINLAKKYNVKGYPTFILANKNGETLFRWWGYSKEMLIDEMGQGFSDLTTIAEKEKRYKAKPDANTAKALASFHDTQGEIKKAAKFYEDAAKFDQITLILQEEFAKNIFPAMKTSWKVYPDHSGHVETKGCNRCHDDKHVSQQQRVITRDCNLCHEINAQGTPGNMETTEVFKALEFKHPVDIDMEWKTMMCSDCHSALF